MRKKFKGNPAGAVVTGDALRSDSPMRLFKNVIY